MIIAIVGDQKAGKTLCGVSLMFKTAENPKFLSRFFSGLNLYFPKGKYNFYSDLTIENLNYKKIDTADFGEKIKNIRITNKQDNMLLLDEFWQNIDSRTSTADINLYLSRVLSQSRKAFGNDSVIFHTVQYLHQFDLRGRYHTQLLIIPEITIWKTYTIKDGIKRSYFIPFQLTKKDKPYEITARFYFKKYMGDFNYVSENYIDHVDQICDNYDTEEMVKPLDARSIYLQIIDKYRPKVEKGDIANKKKLVSLLILDESLKDKTARLIADYLL